MKWSLEARGTRRTVSATSKDIEVVRQGNLLEWSLIDDNKSVADALPKDYRNVGLLDFDFDNFSEPNICKTNDEYRFPFGALLKKLWPGDVLVQLDNMNDWIQTENKKMEEAVINGKRVKANKKKEISQHEFWRFIGVMIASSSLGKGGLNLYEDESKRPHRQFSKCTNLGPTGDDIIAQYRLKDLRSAFSFAFDKKESTSDWARIELLVDGINKNQKKNIASSVFKVLDESMSAWVPRTTATGGLPNISYILRKPEPLGTEFKVRHFILFFIQCFHSKSNANNKINRLFVAQLQVSSFGLKRKRARL